MASNSNNNSSNWKKAEEIVRLHVGGVLTPGSGNKSQKGDIKVKGSDLLIEVKQTDGVILSLQLSWFRKLEKFRSTRTLVLVVFFGLQGTPYSFTPYPNGEVKECDWKSFGIRSDTLPDYIETEHGIWKKESMHWLYSLGSDDSIDDSTTAFPSIDITE